MRCVLSLFATLERPTPGGSLPRCGGIEVDLLLLALRVEVETRCSIGHQAPHQARRIRSTTTVSYLVRSIPFFCVGIDYNNIKSSIISSPSTRRVVPVHFFFRSFRIGKYYCDNNHHGSSVPRWKHSTQKQLTVHRAVTRSQPGDARTYQVLPGKASPRRWGAPELFKCSQTRKFESFWLPLSYHTVL